MITALDKNTALILIDLQQSTLSPLPAAETEKVLSNVNKLIDIFNKKNLPVVIVNVKPTDAAWTKTRKDAQIPAMPDDEKQYAISNKLNTNSNNIFITKHTWNAFFETPLHNELKKRNVTGIVLGGVSTSIGVEGTARAAGELGYNISFALDAMTDRAEEAHERSAKYILPRLGELGNTQDITTKLEEL